MASEVRTACSFARGLTPGSFSSPCTVDLDRGLTVGCVQGVRGLFKGMASPAATVSLQNAVVFYAYGISERLLRSRDPTLAYDSTPLSVVFTAGALQGSAPGCRTVVVPFSLLACVQRARLPTVQLRRGLGDDAPTQDAWRAWCRRRWSHLWTCSKCDCRRSRRRQQRRRQRARCV